SLPMADSKNTALTSDLVNCHACATVQLAAAHCHFCGHRLQQRKPYSLQRSWCYLLTGLVFYVPANMLPIMITNQLGDVTEATIAGGVVILWEAGSWLVATIIFLASLLIPVAKFLAMFGLLLCEHFKTCR